MPDPYISKALRAMIESSKKKFKKESIATIGPKYDSAKPITTGSVQFDAATGIGGFPRGRITEVFGLESSGKTSWCLHIMKNFRQQYPEDKRGLVIIAMEREIPASLLTSIGIDPNTVVFFYPDSANEALQLLVDICAANAADFVLFDSVDGLQSESQIKKKIGESDMKGIAQMMGQTLRQVSKTAIENDVTVLFINQIRDGMDPYGPKTRTSGGNALRFYSSMRVELARPKVSPNIPRAQLIRARIRKNKCAEPVHDEIMFDFIYGRGPDAATDVFEFAKTLGLIRTAGQAVVYRLTPEAEETRLCLGGKAGYCEYVQEHPEIVQQLRVACLEISKNNNTTVAPVPVETEEEEPDPVEE